MPAPTDRTGTRFGRLVALALAGRLNNRWHWRVRCDCGREDVFSAERLVAGKVVECRTCRAGNCVICGKQLPITDTVAKTCDGACREQNYRNKAKDWETRHLDPAAPKRQRGDARRIDIPAATRERARQLREQGNTRRAICEQLGISENTLSRCLDDKFLIRQRERGRVRALTRSDYRQEEYARTRAARVPRMKRMRAEKFGVADLGEVLDVWGETWIVRHELPTEHGVPVLRGHPAGRAGARGRAVILTPALVALLDRGVDATTLGFHATTAIRLRKILAQRGRGQLD